MKHVFGFPLKINYVANFLAVIGCNKIRGVHVHHNTPFFLLHWLRNRIENLSSKLHVILEVIRRCHGIAIYETHTYMSMSVVPYIDQLLKIRNLELVSFLTKLA